MTKDELLKHIGNMKMHSSSKGRALHKPLLLLYAIGQWQQGQQDHPAHSFANIKPKLENLLKTFGRFKKSYQNALEPFIRLEEALWEVRDHHNNKIQRKNKNDKDNIKKLLTSNPNLYTGSLSQSVIDLFNKDNTAVEVVVNRLLEFFPETFYDDISCDVRLKEIRLYKQLPRCPNFRPQVMRAYLERCAMCSYSMSIHTDRTIDANIRPQVIGVEAAHIKPHCDKGPSTIDNALALCSIHHKALDYGAISVNENYQILVSKYIQNYRQVGDLLFVQREGEEIALPQKREHRPSQEFLEWHRSKIFKDFQTV